MTTRDAGTGPTRIGPTTAPSRGHPALRCRAPQEPDRHGGTSCWTQRETRARAQARAPGAMPLNFGTSAHLATSSGVSAGSSAFRAW